MKLSTTGSDFSLPVRASACASTLGGGHDWSNQLPAIVGALEDLPVRSVILDGEGVICGPDGKSEFDRMRACFSRQGASDAFLYAFDVLELDGRDLRNEAWARRREELVQLVSEGEAGIRLREHIEDVNGAVVFRQACVMGLEGIVAKRRDSRYRSGRCREWVKIKNPALLLQTSTRPARDPLSQNGNQALIARTSSGTRSDSRDALTLHSSPALHHSSQRSSRWRNSSLSSV
jgi:hypothetical protein